MNITDYEGSWSGPGIDLSDTIVHVCVCGSELFHLVVSFDDYEISAYSTDMECLECKAKCKAPTPIDKPGYKPENLAF